MYTDSVAFGLGFVAGGLVLGSLGYSQGKKIGAQEEKLKIYQSHMDNNLEWTAEGTLRLRKDILAKEVAAVDNDLYGVGAQMRNAIIQTRNRFDENGDRAEATRFFLERCKFISNSIFDDPK